VKPAQVIDDAVKIGSRWTMTALMQLASDTGILDPPLLDYATPQAKQADDGAAGKRPKRVAIAA
jgi:hypothetical protein